MGKGGGPYGTCHKRSSEDVWELGEASQPYKGLALSEEMHGASGEEGFLFLGELGLQAGPAVRLWWGSAQPPAETHLHTDIRQKKQQFWGCGRVGRPSGSKSPERPPGSDFRQPGFPDREARADVEQEVVFPLQAGV